MRSTTTAALLGAVLFSLHSPGSAQIQSHELQEDRPAYSIHIRYPELGDAPGFDAAVHRIIEPLTAAFRQGQKEMPHPPRPADHPFCPSFLDGQYSYTQLGDGTVSVLFTFAEYVTDAVHPWGILRSLNYNVPRGRVLSLEELFKPGSPYLRKLSAIAIAELSSREYAVPEEIRQGAGPLAKNFDVFTLNGQALILHFQQYQVAAGAAGVTEVAIPLARLRPMLRKGF